MRVHAFRLTRGQDLKKEIQVFANTNNIKAGFIISGVGALEKAVIRMAGAKPEKQNIKTYQKELEIVSLVGTVSINGVHLHISVSDKFGDVFGGHLKDGAIVGVTVEVIIGEDPDSTYTRELDENTGFKELVVE